MKQLVQDNFDKVVTKLHRHTNFLDGLSYKNLPGEIKWDIRAMFEVLITVDLAIEDQNLEL
jgi:hypothetical protein